jgi:hypothetical protein
MVTLGVGVIHVRVAHAQHLLQDDPITKRGAAQLNPILPLAAADYVIDGDESKALMIQVAVEHGGVQ